MQTSQDFVKGQIKDMYDYGFEAYEKIEEIWPNFFEEKEITGDFWQSTSVVGPRKLKKTSQNAGFSASPVKEGYTVYGAIFDYTDAITMSYDTVRDHQKVSNILREAAQGWGEGAKLTREEFYGNFFNKGGLLAGYWVFNGTPESRAITDSSGDLCYDGKPFFNLTANARASINGGTYYNALASGSVTETTITNLYNRIKISNAYGEDDTRVTIKPDTIIFPSQQAFAVRKILESAQVAGSANNDKNVLQGVFKNVIEWPELTDTDAIFVGVAKKGLLALQRMEPVYDFFQDRLSRCWWATVEMRLGGMMRNWRFWAADNLATN